MLRRGAGTEERTQVNNLRSRHHNRFSLAYGGAHARALCAAGTGLESGGDLHGSSYRHLRLD